MGIDLLIAKYDDNIAALAFAARNFLFDAVKGLEEQTDLSANMMSYGLGQGYKGMICTLIFSNKQIKMGFNRAVELPDPSEILTGTGKLHRYVELNSLEDLKSPALKKLVGEAEKSCRSRLKA